jgi:hypothetical protein
MYSSQAAVRWAYHTYHQHNCDKCSLSLIALLVRPTQQPA